MHSQANAFSQWSQSQGDVLDYCTPSDAPNGLGAPLAAVLPRPAVPAAGSPSPVKKRSRRRPLFPTGYSQEGEEENVPNRGGGGMFGSSQMSIAEAVAGMKVASQSSQFLIRGNPDFQPGEPSQPDSPMDGRSAELMNHARAVLGARCDDAAGAQPSAGGPPPETGLCFVTLPPCEENVFDTASFSRGLPRGKRGRRRQRKAIVGPEGPSRFQMSFEEVEALGAGCFSTVASARHRQNGRLFAVKRSARPFASDAERRQALKEVWALSVLSGAAPSIVAYYDSWEEDAHLYIQTELCAGGSVDKYVSAPPAPPGDAAMQPPVPQRLSSASSSGSAAGAFASQQSDECSKGAFAAAAAAEAAGGGSCMALGDLVQALRDAAEALSAMHDRRIAHLDVKPANVLECPAEDGGARRTRFKLADFGRVCGMTRNGRPLGGQVCLSQMSQAAAEGEEARRGVRKGVLFEGDARYLSREMIGMEGSSMQAANHIDLRAVDMFALGASAVELLRGCRVPAAGALWHALREGRPFDHPAHCARGSLFERFADYNRGRPSALHGREKCAVQLFRVVEDMLRPDPAQRCAADQAAKRLAAIADALRADQRPLERSASVGGYGLQRTSSITSAFGDDEEGEGEGEGEGDGGFGMDGGMGPPPVAAGAAAAGGSGISAVELDALLAEMEELRNANAKLRAENERLATLADF